MRPARPRAGHPAGEETSVSEGGSPRWSLHCLLLGDTGDTAALSPGLSPEERGQKEPRAEWASGWALSNPVSGPATAQRRLPRRPSRFSLSET
uniref:Uncharacterized protein n=1 Tax=Rangifer tarandus platyrhynchus TaxID=3082113 RepID=A0ACB0F492_RANTA|nr:unnamed protein product [Rangifer tarandus platyrhynchus]